jgi:hypothetical protein
MSFYLHSKAYYSQPDRQKAAYFTYRHRFATPLIEVEKPVNIKAVESAHVVLIRITLRRHCHLIF